MNNRYLMWSGRALLAVTLVFVYMPIFMVFIYSFNGSALGSVWTTLSLRWYGVIATQQELWLALRNSAGIAFAASTLSLIAGVSIAIVISKWGHMAQNLVLALLIVPIILPDICHAVALSVMLHAMRIERGFHTIVAAHVASGVCYSSLIMIVAVRGLDKTLHEAAEDCGATAWQCMCMVTMPLISPSIAVAWLMVFALSFDDFIIASFTKGVGDDTLPIKIYSRMRFGVRPDTNALFVILALVSALCIAGTRVSRASPLEYASEQHEPTAI